ncbi:hypothetical protein [Acidisoma silvae]|uniref:Uncharacterized protein n=1 Tax=Acidisoma silvae TaxID=2802396 RepID=A0A964E243_9PROT|nr:hypothetical protein [Acidisoma silvae]MCB8878448.1 hypothetical protein [Acidisoma silvae]
MTELNGREYADAVFAKAKLAGFTDLDIDVTTPAATTLPEWLAAVTPSRSERKNRINESDVFEQVGDPRGADRLRQDTLISLLQAYRQGLEDGTLPAKYAGDLSTNETLRFSRFLSLILNMDADLAMRFAVQTVPNVPLGLSEPLNAISKATPPVVEIDEERPTKNDRIVFAGGFF